MATSRITRDGLSMDRAAQPKDRAVSYGKCCGLLQPDEVKGQTGCRIALHNICRDENKTQPRGTLDRQHRRDMNGIQRAKVSPSDKILGSRMYRLTSAPASK